MSPPQAATSVKPPRGLMPAPPHPAAMRETAAGRIRAERLASALRLTPVVTAINLIDVIAVLAVFRQEDAARPVLLIWSAAIVSWLGASWLLWHRERRRPPSQARSPRDVTVMVLLSAYSGLVWAMPAALVYPGADDAHRFFLAAMSCGAICGGAFATATVPRAAFAFAAILTAGLGAGLILSSQPLALPLAGLLAGYLGTIMSCVLMHSRLFEAHLANRIASEQQSDVIGLLLRDFEESASDWLWEIDTEGRLQRVSERMAAAVGAPIDALHGASFATLLTDAGMAAEEPEAAGPQRFAQHVAHRTAFRDLTMGLMLGGEQRWWALTAKPVHDVDGCFVGYRGVCRDVTQAKRTEARILHLAHYDELTGLPNRTLLRDELLRRDLARQEPAGGASRRDAGDAPPGVLCLDLDHFKLINNTLGHTKGDRLLTQVAERLKACVEPGTTVARLGGDEFAVLLPGGGSAAACGLAHRLIEAVGAPYDLDGTHVVTSTSIGIALAPADGDDPGEVLKHADLALYRAKAEGRGHYRVFEPEMDARVRARRSIEIDLRDAFARRGLEVYFQPILDLATDSYSGLEALLRWRHPARGFIPPAEFIPVAEEAGLIAPIGAWVLERACQEAARWPRPLRVAVNLSPLQFRTSNLVEVVVGALAASGLPARRLELEITESVLIDDTETTLQALHQLRALGVRLVLDDFGTGYSSLGYLTRFPFDKIKLDKMFVHELGRRTDCVAIVRAVVTLAEGLGITVTAEGIETEEQLAWLRAEGCDECQGFLMSRPLPAADIAALIGRRIAARAVA